MKCSVKKEGSFKSWSSRTIILSADAVAMLSGDALLQGLGSGGGGDDDSGIRSVVSLKQVAKFKPTDVFSVDSIRGYCHLGCVSSRCLARRRPSHLAGLSYRFSFIIRDARA